MILRSKNSYEWPGVETGVSRPCFWKKKINLSRQVVRSMLIFHHIFFLILVTFLTSASTALSMQNNSIFHDLKSDEMELLYSAYGDETGIQCALR